MIEELVREFGWWVSFGIVIIYALARYGWPWLKERIERQANEARQTRQVLYEERVMVRKRLDHERLERLRQLQKELEAERALRQQEREESVKERELFYQETLTALKGINSTLAANHYNAKEAGQLLRQVAEDVTAVRARQDRELERALDAIKEDIRSIKEQRGEAN